MLNLPRGALEFKSRDLVGQWRRGKGREGAGRGLQGQGRVSGGGRGAGAGRGPRGVGLGGGDGIAHSQHQSTSSQHPVNIPVNIPVNMLQKPIKTIHGLANQVLEGSYCFFIIRKEKVI